MVVCWRVCSPVRRHAAGASPTPGRSPRGSSVPRSRDVPHKCMRHRANGLVFSVQTVCACDPARSGTAWWGRTSRRSSLTKAKPFSSSLLARPMCFCSAPPRPGGVRAGGGGGATTQIARPDDARTGRRGGGCATLSLAVWGALPRRSQGHGTAAIASAGVVEPRLPGLQVVVLDRAQCRRSLWPA